MSTLTEIDAIAAICPLVLCISTGNVSTDFRVEEIEQGTLPEARQRLAADGREFFGITVMRDGQPAGFLVEPLERSEAEALGGAVADYLVSRFAQALNSVGLLPSDAQPKAEVQ